MQTPVCGFCISIGIEGPHDHWLRRKINNDYKTMCPKLLQTICQTCFKKGHTSRYCRVNIMEQKKNYFDKSVEKPKTEIKLEKKKQNNFDNIWGILYMESDDSSDEEEINPYQEKIENQESIFNKPYQYMNWEDVDSDDNELPPIPKSWKN